MTGYNQSIVAVEQAIEYVPVAIAIFDLEMRYLRVSQRFLEEYHLSNDIIGRSHYEVFPDISSEWRQIHQECLAGAVREREEDPYFRSDGSTQWIKWFIRPWYKTSGEISGIIICTEDITKRKQAEIALRHSEERYKSLITASAQIVWILPANGIPIEENPGWMEFTGQTSAESQGEGALAAIHPEDREYTIAAWTEAFQTGDSYQMEYRLRRHDGEYRHVLARGVPVLEADGTVREWVGTCTDIHERKQAVAELEKRNTLLQSILQGIPDVILAKDIQGRYVIINSNGAEFLGKSVEEIIGKDDSEIFPLEVASEIFAKDRQIFSTGKVETYEEDVLYNDVICHSITTKVPWFDSEGNVTGLIGIVRDVTDRKQIEIALQRSQEKYLSLIDATTQIIWDTNPEGELFPEQPQWTAFTGQSYQQFKNWGWLEAVHPEDREQTTAAWSNALTNRGFYECEHRLRRHDGQYRYMSIRGVPILNSDGSIREWIGVHTDITDRKQAEAALQQSEEKFRSLIKAISQIIWTTDTEGRVTSITDWQNYSGLPETSMIGFLWLDAIHPEDREQTNQIWMEAVRTKSLYESECRLQSGDGKYRYFHSRAVPILNSNGTVREWVGISTDIEARKQAEIALNQAKEAAETASHAKSEFLANMSHELRTPLNGILGYAQILQRSPNLDSQQRSRIDIIYQCGSHLLTLINDILDLSKIEAQKVQLMPTDFHFPAFLQSVAEMCRIRAEIKNIEFYYQLAPELPIAIRADEKRLRQVLINLLSNAIKFTDAGSVTFTVNYASAGKIRFAIRDTGIGIVPEKLELIFQPFEQAGDSRRQIEGTGLGLAISQKIVEFMGSKIYVESQSKVGSIFYFDVELPTANEWIKTSHIDDYGQIIGIQNYRPKILIVDDKWENRSVIVHLLTPIGFQVVEAVDGDEAWLKIWEFQPDLIITDLLMPELDGFKLIKRIRNSESFKDILVIVSSASVFETEKQRSLDVGGDDFIPKPVQAIELLNKLQQHLNLKWIYEQKETVKESNITSPNIELVLPPQGELNRIYELAMKGNFRGINKQAALIAKMDDKYLPFARKLQELAQEFQDQEILALIQS